MPSTNALIRRNRHCDNDINYANYQPAINIIPGSTKTYYPNPTIQNGDGPVTLIAGDDDGCYYHHDHHLAVGAIVGIVAGGLVIIIVIFFIVKKLRKRGLGAGAEGQGGPGIVGKLKGMVRRRRGVRGDEEKVETETEMGTRMPGRDPYGGRY